MRHSTQKYRNWNRNRTRRNCPSPSLSTCNSVTGKTRFQPTNRWMMIDFSFLERYMRLVYLYCSRLSTNKYRIIELSYRFTKQRICQISMSHIFLARILEVDPDI